MASALRIWAKCGSGSVKASYSIDILLPLMSISWLLSGCEGPTDRCRPFDSLFIATRYRPYGAFVSLPPMTRCPMLKWTGILSATIALRSFFCSAFQGGRLHLATADSTYRDV